ncbi:ribonuclease H [Anopheles sinensis]|uniref:Ribonuclease H n=1 Tax=Anopheles sinensis TaxID=74873 RepID=A0A084VEM3_ANOSI|nr:ribonuclease H [Anopheles sinensis]
MIDRSFDCTSVSGALGKVTIIRAETEWKMVENLFSICQKFNGKRKPPFGKEKRAPIDLGHATGNLEVRPETDDCNRRPDLAIRRTDDRRDY